MAWNNDDDRKFQDGLNLDGGDQGQGDGGGGGGDEYGGEGGRRKERDHYGGNQGGNQDSTGLGGGDAGCGGSGDAQGGGEYGGDAYSGQEKEHRHKAKEAQYGGDQTTLNAGGDDSTAYDSGNQGATGYGGGDTGYGAGQGQDAGFGTDKTGDDSYGTGDDSYNKDQYSGVSGGLSSDPMPTRGAAGPTSLKESLPELAAGGTLHVGQSLTSPDGSAKLAFQGDGNLVLYKDDRAVWATGTDRVPEKPAMLAVQNDSNVALYGAGGKFAGWATNTGGKGSGAVKFVVADAGVLVLLDGNCVLWSSAPVSEQAVQQIASPGAFSED